MTIRRFKYLALVCFSLLFLPAGNFTLAASLNLGFFDEQSMRDKFSKNIKLEVKDADFALSPQDMQSFIQTKEILRYNPDRRSEIESTDFCRYQKLIVCQLSQSARADYRLQKISTASLDENALESYLEKLGSQVNRDPQDARLQVDDTGKISVFSLSSDGFRLDKEKSRQILIDYFKDHGPAVSLKLAYENVKPAVTTDSIDNLGITALLGEGVSNFAGSPKNRIFNLTLGAKKFNGVLIKPGENFSFLKTLGPVDETTGYLPELVIKGDKTEPDFGGGMCQVSTTAFRAAIMSGLKITSRTPHAYPVQYYNPQGLDATVFIPSPDLKFTNNTPGYILIQTRIVGTQLFFDFFGTDDGRKTNLVGPTITERNPDGSMKATFTQQVTDKSGNMFIDQVFNSAYDSPYKYPHPGSAPLTTKPANWSKDEWKQYKKDNHL